MLFSSSVEVAAERRRIVDLFNESAASTAHSLYPSTPLPLKYNRKQPSPTSTRPFLNVLFNYGTRNHINSLDRLYITTFQKAEINLGKQSCRHTIFFPSPVKYWLSSVLFLVLKGQSSNIDFNACSSSYLLSRNYDSIIL